MAEVGTCVSRKSAMRRPPLGEIAVVIEWDWTSDESGDVSGVGAEPDVSGRIEQVEFIPGKTTSQPTEGYAVQILDQYGRDVLLGVGAVLSNSQADTVKNLRTPMSKDMSYFTAFGLTLEPLISGAGDEKSGTIRMIVR